MKKIQVYTTYNVNIYIKEQFDMTPKLFENKDYSDTCTDSDEDINTVDENMTIKQYKEMKKKKLYYNMDAYILMANKLTNEKIKYMLQDGEGLNEDIEQIFKNLNRTDLKFNDDFNFDPESITLMYIVPEKEILDKMREEDLRKYRYVKMHIEKACYTFCK